MPYARTKSSARPAAGVKVNLGCGHHTPEGWTHVDYALGARLGRVPFFRFLNRKLRLFRMEWDPRIVVHDLRRRFPFADGSVDVVYTSHTLEHFLKEEGRGFLTECHRILRTGGILRVLVPDLRAFIAKLGVLAHQPRRGWVGRLAGAFAGLPHRCMYDEATLLDRFRELGFEAAPRRPFDSGIDDISSIEMPGRTVSTVIVEGKKI
jgi:predicted SAM-dependent methyltransferase